MDTRLKKRTYHGMIQPLSQKTGARSAAPCTSLGWRAASSSASMAPVDRPLTMTVSQALRISNRACSALAYQSCQVVALMSSSVPQWPASCGQ